MAHADPKEDRHLRGFILRLLRLNWDKDRSRLDSTVIKAVLRAEGYEPPAVQRVVPLLQDLKGRHYVTFQQMKDGTGSSYLFDIELTPAGRDLMDGHTEDPAVQGD